MFALRRPGRRRVATAAVVASLAAGSLIAAPAAPGGAAGPIAEINVAAASPGRAVRVRTEGAPVIDTVSVGGVNSLTAAQIAAVEDAARTVGADTAQGRGFSIGMTSVRRGGEYVQRASVTGGGTVWMFPMSTTALSPEAILAVMGTRAAAAIGQGQVVMSRTSAGLRGAEVGDVIDLVAANGAIVSFQIGYVADDAEVGGAEIVMTNDQAVRLGMSVVTRVLVWGTFHREGLDQELAKRLLVNGQTVRIRHSWDPADPDSQIGLGATKALLGEFDYLPGDNGAVSIDQGWKEANLVRRSYPGGGRECHARMAGDLAAAFDEVAAAGLGGLVGFEPAGGCYAPRLNRVSGTIGFLSRHTWAQAADVNVSTNPQGSTPRLDCRVVRIFRKHNFVWGGNFLVPDGMHFEWVGEPRHTYQYPSKYCPNAPLSALESGTPQPVRTQAATMFADDGWAISEHT